MSRKELLELSVEFARCNPDDAQGKGLFALLLRMALRKVNDETLVTDEEIVEALHPDCFMPIVESLRSEFSLNTFFNDEKRQPTGTEEAHSLLYQWFADDLELPWAKAIHAAANADPAKRDSVAADYLREEGGRWLKAKIRRILAVEHASRHPEDAQGNGLFAVLLRMALRKDAGEEPLTDEELFDVVREKCFRHVVQDCAKALQDLFGRGGQRNEPDRARIAGTDPEPTARERFIAEQRRLSIGIQTGYALLCTWCTDDAELMWAKTIVALFKEDRNARDAKAAAYLITSGKHWLNKQIERERRVFNARPLPEDGHEPRQESEPSSKTPEFRDPPIAASSALDSRRIQSAVQAVIRELEQRDEISPGERPADTSQGREARYLLDFEIWAGCGLVSGPVTERLRAKIARPGVSQRLDRYSQVFFEAWSCIADSSVSTWRGPRRTRLLARGAMAFYEWNEDKAEAEIAMETRRATDFKFRLFFALRCRFLHRKPEFVHWEPSELDENENT